MPMIIRTSFKMLVLGLLLTGCRTMPDGQNASNSEIENQLTEPKDFNNYQEVFKYIAKNEGFELDDTSNEDFLLKLAADSKIEVCQLEGFKLPVCIVRTDYYQYFDDPAGVYN